MFDDLDDEERVNLACGALEAVRSLAVGADPDCTMKVADLAPLLDVLNRVCCAAMPKIGNNHPTPNANNDRY